MNYLVVGINHKTAPLSLREKLAFSAEGIPHALAHLRGVQGIKEGVILSTCNRVEVYAAAEGGGEGVRRFLARHHSIREQALDPHLYSYSSIHAVEHLFRVAASLDSMVVGETQIVGQIKRAYEQAKDSQATGPWLNPCFHRALHVAKKVRNLTEISAGALSVGSVAVKLAQRIFADLVHKQVAVVGAGKVGRTVVEALKNSGVSRITLINRSLEKLTSGINIPPPSRGGGQGEGESAHPLPNPPPSRGRGQSMVVSLSRLWEALAPADIMLTSLASASLFEGSNGKFHELMRQRKNRPLFIIDLGVPRNIPEAVASLDNIFLYNLDDLEKVAKENEKARLSQSVKALEIVEEEAREFCQSMNLKSALISQLGQRLEAIRQGEVERTLRKMPQWSDADKLALDKCTQAIVKRILHHPIDLIKSDHSKGHHLSLDQWLTKLFRLDDEG